MIQKPHRDYQVRVEPRPDQRLIWLTFRDRATQEHVFELALVPAEAWKIGLAILRFSHEIEPESHMPPNIVKEPR